MGDPVGVHTDVLAIVTTGAPPAYTRVAPITNWPVTHGGVDVELSAQPAIEYRLVTVTTGCIDTCTRGNVVIGVACPACEHRTLAPKCRMKPGMVCYFTVNAPVLTSVMGPVMLMTAPLPLEIVIPTSLTEIIAPAAV